MARDRNTFAKRQRETKQKQKAEEKRARRRIRKEPGGSNETIHNDTRPEDEHVE